MKTFQLISGSLALEDRPFHQAAAQLITDKFKSYDGYVSYKLTTLGRASDDDVPSFMIITKQHGVILIDLVEDRILGVEESHGTEVWKLAGKSVIESRSLITDLYVEEVKSRLKNHLPFYDRKSKSCKIPIKSLIVFCNNSEQEIENYEPYFENYEIDNITYSYLSDWLDNFTPFYTASDDDLGKIYSLLEGTFIYESKTHLEEDPPLETVNDYIQKSLKTTFKQDEAQRLASMQLPPGPQRIRGLAGTGKTIVLSLKAAITHKKFPNYKVLYLFNTQSLYNHVQSLISKYYTLEAKRAPDFEDKLRVLHAWGGKQKAGLYSELCKKYGLIPLTWGDVKGRGDALTYIYKDLLKKIGKDIKPEYDLVVIDEAQDLPLEVFEVIYRLTKGKGTQKRIIWAYDEFQSLIDTQIKEPEELFGKNSDGEPNMPNTVLDGEYPGGIPKDFVLPNCYRTPRPVLMTAHGVAMGLYTSNQNEMFYNQSEWKAIGYKVNSPKTAIIVEGSQVELERTSNTSQNKLEQILTDNKKKPLNLIQADSHITAEDQFESVAQRVQKLITAQKVAPEEIVIINLHSTNNKQSMLAIQRHLLAFDIDSVIPGYVESADIFKVPGHVTITTPFRAKGNEANVVFVLNAHLVTDDFTLRMRNAFFVAVTRSRGWCYISGIGEKMDRLEKEINHIKQDFPNFRFKCPSKSQVTSNKTFLDRSESELNKIQGMLEMLDGDESIRRLLTEHLKKKGDLQ